jgi:hypothetical protein
MRRMPLKPQPQIERRRVLRHLACASVAWPAVFRRARLPLAGMAAAGLTPGPARALQVGVDHLGLRREEGHLVLDYGLRLELSRVVQEALERGVPIYFIAEATLREERWYWRDKRIQRVQRQWRLAHQPLTSSWRVSTGGLNPQFSNLADALLSLSRSVGWRVAEAEMLAQMTLSSSHYVAFEFRLDTSQLPGPMQIGLTAQDDWTLTLTRRLPVPLG